MGNTPVKGHLILLKFLFNFYLKKKDIEIDPKDINIKYSSKFYKIENKPILFPTVLLQDKTDKNISIEIILFEKINRLKYYKTSTISLLQ